LCVGLYFAPASANFNLVYRYGLTVDPLDVRTHILEVIDWDNFYSDPNQHVLPANGGNYYTRFYVKVDTITNIAAAASKIMPNIAKGTILFTPNDVGLIQVATKLPANVKLSNTNWFAFDRCINNNCLPLMVVRSKSTGHVLVTTTTYAFSSRGTADTDYLGFLGWGVRNSDPALGNLKLLSQILNQDEFGDPFNPDQKLRTDVYVGVPTM